MPTSEMDDDDECTVVEVVGSVNSSASFRKINIKSEKPTPADILADQLCDKLKKELMQCERYWMRKSILLTAGADGKIPIPKLKLLELELGIYFRVADEVVSAIKYLHKNFKHDETFRERVEELNGIVEEIKGTPFAIELVSKIEPSVFLEPLLASARTPLSKLQALITLARTVGMRQVSKKLYDLYVKVRIEQQENDSSEVTGYDIIWFHLNTLLCDGDLCGLDTDRVLIIYEAMLNLCMADARGELNDEFYSISDMLGFSRLSPRSNWRSCLRVLAEMLYCRNIMNPSKMIKLLKHQFESLSILQISQNLIGNLNADDEEIAKFLLSYSVGMKNFYEGSTYVVFMPSRIFEISKRSVKNFWVHNTESKMEADDGDLDFKSTLEKNTDQYLELLTIARNVYTAYGKLNTGTDSEIEPNLRLLLQKLQSYNPFVLLAQSILLSGKYADAAKFIQLAIRTTKDRKEQTVLLLQLLEANVAMRKTKMALTYALDMLNETALVKKSVNEGVGVLMNRRFEDDTFIQIPSECIYHYVTLLLMNTAVISFTKWQIKGDAEMMNLAATIIVLCAQCCWPFCVDMLRNVFELLDGDVTILNAIKMISNRVLFTKLFDTGVKFMEGSKIVKSADVLERFRKERSNKVVDRFTPFQDLELYISSHNVTKNNTSLMQILFS